ncbi:hypothetical protein RND81_01G142400 [Saponaria officinalis]|uniref:K Homology domain-containing protein n=1 Tax=Saponaria officinalis TaxID=3572 RepID=A0AAW1N9Z4_SAPOF
MNSPYSLKRHHNHQHHSHPPPQQQPPPPSAVDSQFRMLCPAGKAGGVIGKGGAVIRHLRDITGARIRIIEDFNSSHCDERVILISNPNPNDVAERDSSSPAQGALVKVFERILKVDEERGEVNTNNNVNNLIDNCSVNNNNSDNGGDNDNNSIYNNVICRMLVGSNQVESVLGRGGKILEKIRQDSCAQVRIFTRDFLPSCALPGDELVQITGNFQAVKKALLLVSRCLLEHSRADTCQGANIGHQSDTYSHRSSYASDHHSRGYLTSSASDDFGPNRRMIPDEDIVYKLLCPVEKAGSLIGKGGCVVRGIENETGASIKINESISPDADERVVVISARETIDLRRSPAQDAVLRVHSRISEIGYEPGAAVVARLLVPSQQIGCLMGKGGFIVNEMRRSTGAGIRIFGRDQGPKMHSPNDEVVQVIGNIPSVQDALFQITSRIRESIFPPRQHFQELPSPSFRPRRDPLSPRHYHSPAGPNHGYGNHPFSQGPTYPPSVSHSNEQDHHHYSGDRPPHPYGPDRPPSPNSWYPQAVNNGHPSRFSDAVPGVSGVVTSNNQSGQMQMRTSVEIAVPQALLPHVYGENGTNLGHLTQVDSSLMSCSCPIQQLRT